MYEDNQMMHVEELLETDFFRGSPLGRKIGGTIETVAKIDRRALLNYRDSYYVPERTVVALAGRFDEKAALALLESKYGRRPAKKTPHPFRKFAAPASRRPRAVMDTRDTEQVQLSLGLPAFQYGHPSMPALSALSVILGGPMSSRLFTEVRVKRGLCYFIHSGIQPFQDTGMFAIQAGLTKGKVIEALKVVVAELRRLKDEDVGAEDLDRAKEYIKGKMVLGLEDSFQLADFYGRQELLTRKIETPEQKIEKVFKVTPADIRRAAGELFRPTRLCLAVIGPEKSAAPFIKEAAAL